MKRTCILLAVSFLAVLAVTSGVFASSTSFSEFPAEINGVKFESIDELFKKAGSTYIPGKKPPTVQDGDPEAQYQLGVLFYYILKAGHENLKISGVDALDKTHTFSFNYTQMMYWLKRAALQGHVQAQFLLGYMNYWGMFLGGICDIDEMQRWYEKAAAKGHARAQAHLADMYRIMRPDKDKAFHWAKISAEQGDAYGMHVLSMIYNDSSYSEYNPEKANEWEKKAREAAKNDPTIEISD